MKTILSFFVCIYFSLSIGYPQTILFQDDFEDGNAFDWEYEDGWQVILEDTNYVFEGIGHHWATTPVDYHNNITFIARIKLVSGGFHLNILFRSGRYFMPIYPTYCHLIIGETHIGSIDYDIQEGVWHTTKVILKKNNMKFFIDDSLFFEYNDPERPNLYGKLAFEGIDHAYLDDVVIVGGKEYIQEAAWIRTGGPLGGIGYDVRIDPSDPNIIYVTDQWAGCHKSYDGGNTWHPKNDGISSLFGPTGDSVPIFCLTVDPNNPNIIWCGTIGMRGVYKSTDKAENWELKVNGIPDTERLTFRSFAIQPGNSDIVYCGTEWALYENEIPSGQRSASKGKIYKTSDGGENWTEILDSDALVRTIIIDPINTNIVYAATGIFDRDDVKEKGIWKSTDAGSSWTNINNGISNLTVGDIEMHPTNSNILLAATGRLNGFGGGPSAEVGEVLRSTDGGQTWNQSIGGHDFRPFTYVEYDAFNPNIVYAAASDRGFFKSVNGGVSFFETTYNPPYINPGHIISIATHSARPNWVITNGYGGGVFISDDGAETWQVASKGYTGCEVADVAVAQTNPLKLFAVARSSIFKSENAGVDWEGAGAMWTHFNDAPIGPLEMRCVVIHPIHPDIVIASDMERKIFRTITGGKNWDIVYELPSDEIKTIAFAPSNPNIVYAGAIVRGGYQIDRPFPFDPTRPCHGMLKSVDKGKSWQYINNGLETTKKNINHIAVHPNNPNTVYIGTLNSGVYKTVDGGQIWFPCSDGILVPDIRAIAIDYTNPDIIYAGAQRGGIYKTIDAGQTWTPIIYGMDAEAAIRSIAIDPTNPQTIYAGDWLSGVYRSLDGGKTWYHINKGLRTRAVQKLVISNDGKILYAGTQGEGVFRLTFEQIPVEIQSVNPDTSQIVHMTRGDSLLFSVYAYDVNNDLLSFQWRFNDHIIEDEANSHYLLRTDTLSIADYTLSVDISDGIAIKRVGWQIQITESSANLSNRTNFSLHYELSQNYPNPFNSRTVIKFALEKENHVVINIFDILGRKVETLVDKKYQAGHHYIVFNANKLASGIYFYEIETSNFHEIRKALLLK